MIETLQRIEYLQRAIREEKDSLENDELSEFEREMTEVIIADLEVELKELGFTDDQ